MSRVIAAYDLDEDHGRLWVNADLKRMPEVVVVANQPMDRAQTVTYVPEPRLLEAMDAAREAERRADVAERVATDRKGLCDSLRETNDDLRRIIGEMRAATVGVGTCHDLAVTPAYSDKTKFECSECGYEYSAVGGFGCDYGDEPDFRFCPNCGRRCVG